MNILLERPLGGEKASRRVARLMQALARDQRRLQRAFSSELLRIFERMGRDAARGFRNLKEGDGATVMGILHEVNVPRLVALEIKPRYQKHYLRVLTQTHNTVETALSLGIRLPDHVGRAIVQLGGRRVGLVDFHGQARESLFATLLEGREQGLAREALARRIQERISAGRFRSARTRALVISRTETKYAQNVSTLAVYKEADVITGVLAYDNRTGYDDPDCSARDGEVFSFDDAQAETDDEHPNGTLSWGPVTGG